MRGEEGNSLRLLGEVACAQNDIDLAEQYVHNSIAILDEVGDEYEGARSRLTLGSVYLAQNDAQQAFDALSQCIVVFERLHATLDLAKAHALRETISQAV
jgi:hypothetical protein